MTLRHKWKTRKERWKYRYVPPVANWAIGLSTLQARKKIGLTGDLKILIDNSVLGHAVTHETAWASTGSSTVEDDICDRTGYLARVSVFGPDAERNDSAREIYEDVKYLPGIAHLARCGHLGLYTSAELRAELLSQPPGRFRGYGIGDFNVFYDIQLQSIDGHAFTTLGPRWMNLPSVKEQQQARLSSRMAEPLFGGLVRRLGPRNNLDVWHIRTAEINRMFCFLTMDFKLKRAIKSKRHLQPFKSLNTKIMTPEEFGQWLGLYPLPPLILSYHCPTVPVRSDLYWPDSKRRLGARYRKQAHAR